MHNTFYTIIAPDHFYANSNYILALTLHNPGASIVEPCVVNISIQDEQNVFRVQRETKLPVDVTELFTIPIADVPIDHNYKLVVESFSGICFRHEAPLNLQKRNLFIVVQSDKNVYKTGDCMRFRILVLDHKLRPVNAEYEMFKISILVSI